MMYFIYWGGYQRIPGIFGAILLYLPYSSMLILDLGQNKVLQRRKRLDSETDP
jgi:hypothetical protein